MHIFNLGTGRGATVLEVIQAFAQASGKVGPVGHVVVVGHASYKEIIGVFSSAMSGE